MEIPGTKVFQFNVFVTAELDQTEDDVRERLKSVVVRGMLLGPGGKGYSKRFVAVRIVEVECEEEPDELDSDEEPQPVCTCTLANVDYINDCPVHDARTMAKYEEARAKHLGELRAEREMVQAQTPVVNEDGGR